jgi:hypothetical protein
MATAAHTTAGKLIFKEYCKGRSLTYPIFKKNGSVFKCLQPKFKTVKSDDVTADIPRCDQEEFESFQKLLDHLNTYHWIRILKNENNYCLFCEVIFEIKCKAKKHRQSQCFKNIHTCRICQMKRFKTHKGLAFHFSKYHKNEVLEEKTSNHCTICNKVFAAKVIKKLEQSFSIYFENIKKIVIITEWFEATH